MPKVGDFSCPRHEVDEDDERWTQALMIMADELAHGSRKNFSPCPWCLEELMNDVREAHGLLDTLGIPRKARGKAVLSMLERLHMLMELEGNISELRTS